MSDIDLRLDKQHVRMNSGELRSYLIDGVQVIHQKGSPGWRNSDTEMFPIIGPTSDAGFQVSTPRGSATQDQHGLLRELDYEEIENSEVHAVFEKRYVANTLVNNSKFPAKSTAEFLSWPYDFRFRKTFNLDANGLTISFGVSSGQDKLAHGLKAPSGEKGMPFMLGYHPAFKLVTEVPTITPEGGEAISLAEVLAVGSRALEVPNCNQIILNDQLSLKLKSSGFRHFMCWTEVPNMVCVEPITFYPYAVSQENLHEGFDQLEMDGQVFSLRIEVA